MSSKILLLTGGTGFIGFHVLLKALEEGWVVRAAVRSASKSDFIANHPKVKALDQSGRLSFVEVPDICDQNAYEEAIKNVTHVIHLAAPIPSPFLNPVAGIYEPNIKSVTAILHAAAREPSVQKLVITSSIYGNIPFPPDPTQRITADFRAPTPPGPFHTMIPAYSAGKIAAAHAIDTFEKENELSFGITVVFPGFVFGRDYRSSTVDEFITCSNRILVGAITGKALWEPIPAGATHIDDVVNVHIQALGHKAPRNIGVTVPCVFEDAWEIVAKHFPKAVKTGVFTKGSQPTIPVNWDASQTEVDLGLRFKTYEDMVVDAGSHYLELVGKEKA